jgi:hypothetical protein
MKKILAGFLICLFMLSCSKKEDNQKKITTYVISYENQKHKNYSDSLLRNNSNLIEIPKRGIYGESQLVIDKKGNLYFYQNAYVMRMCGTRDENDTLPHFLDLKPKDFVQIPENSLGDFISKNILTKEKNRRILIIASQCDTIKNISFLNFLSNNQLNAYYIRKTTQEEDTVLQYKIGDKYYDFEYVKWDKTKIKFPDYIKLNTHSN